MIEHPDGTRTPLIDASVHIFFSSNKELRSVLREPFKSRGFPDYEMDWYGAPGGEYAPNTEGPDRQYPGSDPEIVGNELFSKRGVDVAILHPMARGIMPDRHLGTALHAAHNEMMVSKLARAQPVRRPIPRHDSGEPRRHRRRAERDREVAQAPSSGADRRPAAVPRGLRQATVLAALGSGGRCGSSRRRAHRGRLWHRQPADPVRQHPHLRAVRQLHGTELPVPPDEHDRRGSLRAFPRPEVRLGDGAADFITPFMWRMDTFGRPHLEQTPWAPRIPSDYLPGHIFFVQGSLDGPGDADFAGEWFGFTGKEDMVMFGSSYPHWQCGDINNCPRHCQASNERSCAGAMRPTCTGSTFRSILRPASRRIEGTRESEAIDMTLTHSQERVPAAERIAVRCVDSDVHPRPERGELVPYIPEPWRSKYFLKSQCRRADLLRRPRLRARLCDAHRLVPAGRRVRRQRPGHGIPAADHGSRFRHRRSWNPPRIPPACPRRSTRCRSR